MNRLLRTLAILTGLCIAIQAQAKLMSPTDSLVIRFANRTRLVIYAPDKAGIQALSNYDLNKIVREMGMKLDSVPGGKTAISQEGGRFLKDTVLVITKQKDGVTIVVNGDGDTTRTSSQKKDNTDRDYDRARRRKRSDGNNFDYTVSIGLNTLIQQSANPSYPEGDYALKPLGSRYFALSAGAMPTLVRGKYASLKLYYGVEVAGTTSCSKTIELLRKELLVLPSSMQAGSCKKVN